MNLNQVKLGNEGLTIPNIGLGCMGMTGFGDTDMYGKTEEKEAIATIHRSLELGGNFLDTFPHPPSTQIRQMFAKSSISRTIREQFTNKTRTTPKQLYHKKHKCRVPSRWQLHAKGCKLQQITA